MFPFVLLVLALIGAGAHVRLGKEPKHTSRLIRTLLLYILVFNAGVGGLIGFIGHTFIADEVAESIGWPKGNPFQFEVGVANLSYGVLGFLCIWIRGTFWIAVGLGFSVFLLGAAYGHIADIVVHENYAPNNAGAMLYADILIPLVILGLLIVDRRGQSQAS